MFNPLRNFAIGFVLSVFGCTTQFKPTPDAGVGNPAGEMSASSSGSMVSTSSGGVNGGNGSSSGGSVSQGGSSGTVGGGMGGSSGNGMRSGGSSGGVVSSSGANPGSADGGTSPADGGSGLSDSAQTTQVTCPAMSTLQAGDTMGTIQAGGTTRQYIVHVPTGYTGQSPVPLVLDYHPILTDYTFERSNSGYATKADQEGFIVVFPNGIDNAWNVGPCCTTSRTVDDVGFSRALIAQLEGQVCIDPKRIYAVGYSMGGGMAMKMGCDAADIIAAIAPAAFDLMDPSNMWVCQPSRPITVISFRGTADPIVPYNGGPTNPPNGLPVVITFLGAVGTFQKWADLDQCTGMPSDNSSLGTGCQTYMQCAQGVSVSLCTTQGGGHSTGDPNIAWSMISQYTLP